MNSFARYRAGACNPNLPGSQIALMKREIQLAELILQEALWPPTPNQFSKDLVVWNENVGLFE